MELAQIAAEMYTIRDQMKTPAELAAALAKLRKIGYRAVEVGGLPVSDKEMGKMLREEGIACCGVHQDPAKLLAEPKMVVERLEALGCRYAVYPHPSGVKLEKVEDGRALAAKLNAAGKALAEAGWTLAYHNHSIEFRRLNGRLLLEVIYEETEAANLQAELDTYWVQHGGGDPVDWCRRLRGRLPLLHLKDYVIDAESKPTYAEIGLGNLNWEAILAAAEEAGCQWYIVEQDICARDPFESLKLSFDYLASKFAAS